MLSASKNQIVDRALIKHAVHNDELPNHAWQSEVQGGHGQRSASLRNQKLNSRFEDVVVHLQRFSLHPLLLQARQPAISENRQGGFVSSLPSLTHSSNTAKRRTLMSERNAQGIKNQTQSSSTVEAHPPCYGALPAGLERCKICNEFCGVVRNEDLPVACQREEAVVVVQCICDGIFCRKCGEGRVHRPISNYWDEAKGALIHRPWYSAQEPCELCERKFQTNAESAIRSTNRLQS